MNDDKTNISAAAFEKWRDEGFRKGYNEGLAEGYANGCADGYEQGWREAEKEYGSGIKLPSADDFALGPFHDTGG